MSKMSPWTIAYLIGGGLIVYSLVTKPTRPKKFTPEEIRKIKPILVNMFRTLHDNREPIEQTYARVFEQLKPFMPTRTYQLNASEIQRLQGEVVDALQTAFNGYHELAADKFINSIQSVRG
jgi:hypothetical protein